MNLINKNEKRKKIFSRIFQICCIIIYFLFITLFISSLPFMFAKKNEIFYGPDGSIQLSKKQILYSFICIFLLIASPFLFNFIFKNKIEKKRLKEIKSDYFYVMIFLIILSIIWGMISVGN